jgi:hypothetical protein
MSCVRRNLLLLLLICCWWHGADGLAVFSTITTGCCNRRQAVLASFTTATVSLTAAQAAAAAESSSTNVLVQGTVTLPPDYITAIPSSETTTPAALYITCRPAVADNVPAAILSGTRGKAPPVLAARFANPTFPYTFALTTDNLTPEGATAGGDWWMNSSSIDLVVSARWDSDGVAATRSPNDFVGRGLFQQQQETVTIPLQGRGAFGKFATSTNKR